MELSSFKHLINNLIGVCESVCLSDREMSRTREVGKVGFFAGGRLCLRMIKIILRWGRLYIFDGSVRYGFGSVQPNLTEPNRT